LLICKISHWIAVVDRALIGDQEIREFIAVHCVDYQTLPLERDRVLFALGHVAGMAALAGQAGEDARAAAVAANLFGDTPVMRTLRGDLSKIAAVDAPVLITGESGTGKELVAPRCSRNIEQTRPAIRRDQLRLALAVADSRRALRLRNAVLLPALTTAR